MFRSKFIAVLAAVALASQAGFAAVSFTENFSTNPTNTWSYGIGDNTNTQIIWNASAPPAWAGDSVGELDVHLDSSLPTVRFQRLLGVTLTDTNSFTLSTVFSFNVINAPGDQQMQIAFGLVNSALTGGDRTGSPTNFYSDNTFHTVEFDYFPNVSALFGGPTLTPTVFGAQVSSNADAFSNIASIFGSDSDLGDNINGITALPQNVTLRADLVYNGATKTITLTMSQVNSNGTLTVLDTELPSLTLTSSFYNVDFPFQVDSLAILAYQDGFTTTDEPSLVADLRFQEFDFTSDLPQAPSYVSIAVINTNVSLTFPTISNDVYDVQSTTDLVSGAWSTIASNLAGSGEVITNVDVGGATVPQRFYRVRVVVP
jgi:hypothetical protein